jgi:hypothetical protein
MSFCNEDLMMTLIWPRSLLFVGVMAALTACSSGPQITRTQEVAESADNPYQKILVITLLSKFDSRRFIEDSIVSKLAERGTTAVASTSLMNTRTPLVRETFKEMVENLDADAVLVTQLVSLRSEGTFVDMSPEATVNLRPTGYWNVFSVDTTEYVEPQAVDFEHTLSLLTELYSVGNEQTVWGIQSRSNFTLGFDRIRDFSVIEKETEAIARHLSRDGLIER